MNDDYIVWWYKWYIKFGRFTESGLTKAEIEYYMKQYRKIKLKEFIRSQFNNYIFSLQQQLINPQNQQQLINPTKQITMSQNRFFWMIAVFRGIEHSYVFKIRQERIKTGRVFVPTLEDYYKDL